MMADSQDVDLLDSDRPELAIIEGFSRRRDRRRQSRIRTPKRAMEENEVILSKDVPHCKTCLCLPGKIKYLYRQMSFCDRYAEHRNQPLSLSNRRGDEHQASDSPSKPLDSQSSTGRRRSGCNTAVDKLLREMELNASMLSNEKLQDPGGRQLSVRMDYPTNQPTETDASSSSWHRCQHRRSSSSGNYFDLVQNQIELSKTSDLEPQICSSERRAAINPKHRSPVKDVDCAHQGESVVVPTSDNIGNDIDVSELIDNVKDKWMPIDRKNSTTLLGAGDHDRTDDLIKVNDTSSDELKLLLMRGEKGSLPSERQTYDEDSSTKEFGNSDVHVRELKLVRLEFIERIYEEMRRLQRLQRHLDECSPRRSIVPTRSISTMTSTRI